MFRSLALTTSLLALAACGGGGGTGSGGGGTGGGGSTQPGPGDPLPDGDATLQGQAIAAGLPQDADGNYILQAFGAPGALTVNTRGDTPNGPAEINLVAGGTDVEINLESAFSSTDIDGRVLVAEDEDGTIFFSTETDDDLEYTDFADWVQIDTSDSDEPATTPFFFGVVGAPTPTSQMPSGNADYVGKTIGVVGTPDGARITTSDVAVSTDFSAVTVTTSNTFRESEADDGSAVAAGSIDFTASGGVSGSAYTATGDGMTVDGNFYGPSAQETSGLFRGQIDGQNYGGAFAAN